MTMLPTLRDSILRDAKAAALARLILVACFASMADCEQHDLVPVEQIQDNIGAMPDGNDPFPELRRHLRRRASNLRMSGKFADSCADCTGSAPGCVGT